MSICLSADVGIFASKTVDGRIVRSTKYKEAGISVPASTINFPQNSCVACVTGIKKQLWLQGTFRNYFITSTLIRIGVMWDQGRNNFTICLYQLSVSPNHQSVQAGVKRQVNVSCIIPLYSRLPCWCIHFHARVNLYNLKNGKLSKWLEVFFCWSAQCFVGFYVLIACEAWHYRITHIGHLFLSWLMSFLICNEETQTWIQHHCIWTDNPWIVCHLF